MYIVSVLHRLRLLDAAVLRRVVVDCVGYVLRVQRRALHDVREMLYVVR